MSPAMRERLQAAADEVGHALRAGQAPREVIALLQAKHRATWACRSWTNTLRVAGVTATCTWSKDEGLLAAWRKNATLRLSAEQVDG